MKLAVEHYPNCLYASRRINLKLSLNVTFADRCCTNVQAIAQKFLDVLFFPGCLSSRYRLLIGLKGQMIIFRRYNGLISWLVRVGTTMYPTNTMQINRSFDFSPSQWINMSRMQQRLEVGNVENNLNQKKTRKFAIIRYTVYVQINYYISRSLVKAKLNTKRKQHVSSSNPLIKQSLKRYVFFTAKRQIKVFDASLRGVTTLIISL